MKLFTPGHKYLLLFPDGSKVVTYAEIDAQGEIDLRNDHLEFSLWVTWKNLEGIEVQKIN